jgi:hydroxymethylbilane synthase
MIPVVLGTRGSPLALAQTRLVLAALKRAWPARNFEIHIIKTQGDRLAENPPAEGETLEKGIFTAELERALFEKKIDLAVHSLKDMPTAELEGLVIAAIPKRADARDVLITSGAKTLADLPPDAQIATGSPRRAAQLLLARADLRIAEIRGNIDTRLQKFRANRGWSGLILAAAGLERLQPDVSGLTVTPLPFDLMLPAPGQGALALQTRAGDKDVLKLVGSVHDPVTAAAVTAERMFLHGLGGGCQEPIAAYAEPQPDESLRLEGIAWLFGETRARRGRVTGKRGEAKSLGVGLAVEVSR